MEIFLASLPIILLIALMGVFKMSGDKSSVITLGVTIVLALTAFHLSGTDTFNSFLYGAIKAISPILIIIWMAIYSYNVLVLTKKMEILKQQFASISTDKSIQVLLITWGFGGLLEAMAGFGTAVAIPAAILIGLGFKPGFSALVSLIANSVATAFGAVGTPVIVLAQETGLSVHELSSTIVLQQSVLMFLIPFILVFLSDPHLKSLPKNLLLSVAVGSVSFLAQYLAACYLGAETPAILGSLASILVIILLAKVFRKHTQEKETITPIKYTTGQIFQAWIVYILILGLVIITSPLFPAIRNTLDGLLISPIQISILGVPKLYPIHWLTHTGLLLFIGAFAGGFIQGASVGALLQELWKTLVQLKKTIITVICLVSLSTIMDTAGMINILAVALATATGALYPLFAPAIGALGTFLTGSDTSANILFGKLQAQVAANIGVDPTWLSASNTVGATGGKIISPQSIAIATSASGHEGQEGNILKSSLPYAIGYVIIAGVLVYFFS
ncbi:L-lactate permease [Parabacteroides pacaensis]|uniref:L-lactate permease n=1 Tax=Parabacteroides pacaensis TaxID=2086575 RepID=UPI000D1108AE|nr:L-lactate permease [Parabacteroides pacaensis]